MDDFVLTDDQTAAVSMGAACAPGETRVIRGLAGTGKTTALKKLAEAKNDDEPLVLAPTGRAALRVKEAAGLRAMTIHKWCFKPVENKVTGLVEFVQRTPDELPGSGILFLDEGSMVGKELHDCLRAALRAVQYEHGIKLGLVACGDAFQLPPVEPGNPDGGFSLMSDVFPCDARTDLRQIVRQAKGNPIIEAGFDLREGRVQDALDRLPGLHESQALDAACWVHSNGGVVVCHRNITRHRLNLAMRASLGHTQPAPQSGEPLLVRMNNYDLFVFNGESATFLDWLVPPSDDREIDLPRREEGSDRRVKLHPGIAVVRTSRRTEQVVLLREEFDASEERAKHSATEGVRQSTLKAAIHQWAMFHAPASIVPRPRRVWDDDKRRFDIVPVPSPPPLLLAELGYVFTAHKMQGSQSRDVLVVLEPTCLPADGDHPQAVLRRRWIYTAITRATKDCALAAVGWEWP